MRVWEEIPWIVGALPLYILVVLSNYAPLPPERVETLGGISQLFGVVFIVIAVDHELGQHGASQLGKAWRWVQRRFRRLLGRTTTHNVFASDGAEFGVKTYPASVMVALPKAMSEIEKRLKQLEGEVQNLRKQVVGQGKQLKRLADRLEDESHAIRRQLDELREDAAASAAGRARWDLTGAALFFQGIVFTTWSAGIAQLFG